MPSGRVQAGAHQLQQAFRHASFQVQVQEILDERLVRLDLLRHVAQECLRGFEVLGQEPEEPLGRKHPDARILPRERGGRPSSSLPSTPSSSKNCGSARVVSSWRWPEDEFELTSTRPLQRKST